MSNYYEMMYILRPDLSEEQVTEAVNKYKDFLSEKGETNFTIKSLGKKRLAYPIKRYLDGIYVQMNYQADGTQIAPLERAMRLEEEVIRYLTIKLKKQPSITAETVEVEIEEQQVQPTEPAVAEA